MTRDEAIKGLHRILGNYYRVCNEHLLNETEVAEEINSLNMAIEALEKYEEAYEHGWTEAESKYREILERKRGEWVEAYEDYRQQISWWECSVCKYGVSWEANFCPNCGADMRGGEHDTV